jgi:polyphosphate kinase
MSCFINVIEMISSEVSSTISLSDPSLYISRDLSLLEFQRRVLEEAQDEDNPLLERVKFLAHFGSNMDEFFMVRVANQRRKVEANVVDLSIDGLTPRELLAAIRKLAVELDDIANRCLQRKLLPSLEKAGIHLLDYDKLTDTQKEKADAYFQEVVYPVLTPLALDLGHPFPHISNLSLNLAIVIREPKGNEKIARLKVPGTLPRLVPIKRSSGATRKDGTIAFHHYFVWLEQLIAANVGLLFPGMEIVSVHPFRIVRDADIEIQELEADDLLESMQASIRKRKFGSVAQVGIYEDMPAHIRELLVDNLEINSTDLFIQRKPLGLGNLWQVYNSVERYDLKFPTYIPHVPKVFKSLQTSDNIFEAIRQENILLHHPYDSFNPVIDFLNAAARDPNVLAIKQTLYRVGRDSPVVDALLEARERDKQVAVLLELKARFDEESNISWARKLEEAGVHVVYGVVGLKTHSKICLVVRQEGERIRRYVHLATGNYNHLTSNQYEDIGLFTSDEAIGADATDVFNYITGYSTQSDYRKLLVAPVNLRKRLESLIEREVEHAKKGNPARLIFKVNAIVDPEMIRVLYQASQAGVKLDLLVRGMCCLLPGVKNVSENIRVISIVGRYLEHSRIYYFQNNGKEEIYLGSADLMDRNLNRRVEVVFPVETSAHVHHLRENVLEAYLHDNLRARVMHADGTYKRLTPKNGKDKLDVQEWLMARNYKKT